MRVFLAIVLVCLMQMAAGQTTPREMILKSIGLKITLPKGFQITDAKTEDRMKQVGKKAMESVAGQEIDLTGTKTLLSANKNTFEYISVTTNPFDEKKDGKYSDATKAVGELLYNTFKDKMTEAVLDSASSFKTIGSRRFSAFTVKATINNHLLFTICVFNRLQKNVDLGITYLFLKPETQADLETMLKNVTFVN